jgi:hypothetical protein
MATAVLRPTLVLVVCLLAAVASADEVELKNGDRYSGSVVTLSGGVLKFDTGRGTVDVPWDEVMTATIDTPVVVTAAGAPPRTVTWVMLMDGSLELPDVVVPATAVVSLTRPAGPPTLAGGINAGFLSTGGNSNTTSLRLDVEAVVRAERNRYTTNVAVNRSSEHETETAHNATLNARWDHFVSPRMYTNGSAIFTADRFRDLTLRTALGVGLGFQVAESALLRMSVEGGYGYVNKQSIVAPDDRYHAARETATIEVPVVGPRLVLFHRHDGFFGLRGNDKLFIQTRNGFRVGLVGGLVTTLEGDLDYDHAPSPGQQQMDRAFNLTFGYRF